MTLQTLPMPDSLWPHVIEATAFGVGLFLKYLYDGKRSEKHADTVKQQRNEELDSRLNNIRQAIKSSTEVIQQDVVTLSGDLRAVKGTVEVVASDVKGLKDRELARLESDAGVNRRRKR